MRIQIFAHLEAGGVGLDPAVRVAIERLAKAESEVRGRKAHTQ
jgi:hypothetical protein